MGPRGPQGTAGWWQGAISRRPLVQEVVVSSEGRRGCRLELTLKKWPAFPERSPTPRFPRFGRPRRHNTEPGLGRGRPMRGRLVGGWISATRQQLNEVNLKKPPLFADNRQHAPPSRALPFAALPKEKCRRLHRDKRLVLGVTLRIGRSPCPPPRNDSDCDAGRILGSIASGRLLRG